MKFNDIYREGFNREGNIESRGIIPRAIEQVFNHIQSHASTRKRFLVRASYLQIYNEQVRSSLSWCTKFFLLRFLTYSTDFRFAEART